MNIKFDIEIKLTASRTLAYFILIISSTFAFIFNSSEVIIFGISMASALHGLTSWSDGITKRKQIKTQIKNE